MTCDTSAENVQPTTAAQALEGGHVHARDVQLLPARYNVAANWSLNKFLLLVVSEHGSAATATKFSVGVMFVLLNKKVFLSKMTALDLKRWTWSAVIPQQHLVRCLRASDTGC